MGSMNERFVELRTKLDLTQDDLGKKLNLSRFAISNYETGKRELPDRTVADVCREFNINEDWLRTGEGEMFYETRTELVDRIMKEHGRLEGEDREFLEVFIQMSPEERKLTRDFIKMLATKVLKGAD